MHFAFVAPPFLSHVRALEALAIGLIEKGHQASWFHLGEMRQVIRADGIGFFPVGRDAASAISVAAMVRRAARPGGPLGLQRVIRDVACMTDLLCHELPAAFERMGIDAVIADQMEAAGGLVAKGTGLPFVSVACALPVNREPRLPLPVMPWSFARDERGLRLNAGSERVHDWLMKPHARVIERHARRFGLPLHRRLDDCVSALAQFSQLTPEMDFPRTGLPSCFHHVGPLRSSEPAGAECMPPIDPSTPLAFASLGTLQGGRFGLFTRIVRGCRAAGLQVLVAHCDQLHAGQQAALRRAGAQAIVGFAPQAEAIAAASIVITHGGLNTVMDSVAAGKPMLVLPIAFDQPGMAARVVHAGCGLALPHRFASASRIAGQLRRLREDASFAARARELGASVRAAGGAPRAVALLESALAGARACSISQRLPAKEPGFARS